MQTRVPGFNPNVQMTLVKRLRDFLKAKFYRRSNPWVSGCELEMLAPRVEAKPSTIARTLRSLAEKGLIFRTENEKGHVMYSHYDESAFEIVTDPWIEEL